MEEPERFGLKSPKKPFNIEHVNIAQMVLRAHLYQIGDVAG